MLVTTGIVALTRKIKDDKEKKQAKQGMLKVGPSDVAKRAFEGQTSRMIEAGNAGGMSPSGPSRIKYEDPNDISASTPTSPDLDQGFEKPDVKDARRTSQLTQNNSPIESDVASLTIASPRDQTLTSTLTRHSADYPPPYASRHESTKSTTSSTSTSDPLQPSLTRPSTRSTNSHGTHAVRVKTNGPDLASGFPYDNALFDLHIHPHKWSAFSSQIVTAAKVAPSDTAKVWAAAAATAMTGAVATSIYLGRSMRRSYQEKTVKNGISDMSAEGLGAKLQAWNDEYFTPKGLFVHVELSESAMKHAEQSSKALRKPTLLYSKKEDRERKEGERKFVVVVTKLDGDGVAREAAREMEIHAKEQAAEVADEVPAAAEMPGDTHQGFLIPELPGDDGLGELPGGLSLGFGSEKSYLVAPEGYAELEPDGVTAGVAEKAMAREMDTGSEVLEKDGWEVGGGGEDRSMAREMT